MQKNHKSFTRGILSLIFGILVFFSLLLLDARAKDNVEKMGDALLVLIPSSAYATTFFFNDKEGRYQFYKSFFTNLAATFTLKYTINKPRPEDNGDYSFPSGHTSTSFQSATFIHRRYGWEYGIPAYLASGFVAWSRIESEQHDWGDVTAGAALGILCGYYFTEPFENVFIAPIVGDDMYGLKVTMSW